MKKYLWAAWGFAAGIWFPMIFGWAIAADTPVPCESPTDWTALSVLAAIFVVSLVIVGYILYLKQPGQQFGEDQIERLAEALRSKKGPPVFHISAPAEPAPSLTFEGLTFATAADLAAYKAAKGV